MGKKIFSLTCLGEDIENPYRWMVRCDCGNVKSIERAKFGRTQSCGCRHYEKQKDFFGKNQIKDETNPKGKKLDMNAIYSFPVKGCSQSVQGVILNEYKNTVSIQVINTMNTSDKAFVRQKGYKFVIKKLLLKQLSDK